MLVLMILYTFVKKRLVIVSNLVMAKPIDEVVFVMPFQKTSRCKALLWRERKERDRDRDKHRERKGKKRAEGKREREGRGREGVREREGREKEERTRKTERRGEGAHRRERVRERERERANEKACDIIITEWSVLLTSCHDCMTVSKDGSP